MNRKKVIVITGGGEGLGAAIAHQLKSTAHKIWLLARDVERLSQMRAGITSEGFSCEYLGCDITNEDQVNTSISRILDTDKRIDVLINNAAVWVDVDIENLVMLNLVEAFKSNVLGHMIMTGRIATHMKECGGGTVLNVLSTSAIDAEGDWPVYVSTKFALMGFSNSLKKRYAGTGVRFMDVFPGGINTNFYLNADVNLDPTQQWMMDKNHVANMIAFIVNAPSDVNIDSITIRKNDKN